MRVSPAGARPARQLDSDDETDGDDDDDGGGVDGGDAFMDEYAKAMRRQLRGTDVAATFSKNPPAAAEGSKADGQHTSTRGGGGGGEGGGGDGGGKSRLLSRGFGDHEDDSEGSSDEEDDDAEDDEALDLDLNLVESMLASYKGQEGMSGPASNLLASMGVSGVSFDNFGEDEDEDEDA